MYITKKERGKRRVKEKRRREGKKKEKRERKDIYQGHKHLPRKAVARKRKVATGFLRISYVSVAAVPKFISFHTKLLKDRQECYRLLYGKTDPRSMAVD